MNAPLIRASSNAASRQAHPPVRQPDDRPSQTRARLRLAAPARRWSTRSASSRMRCGRPTSTRCPMQGRAAARLRQPAGARQGGGGARQRCKLDEELRGSYILAADTVVAVGRRILPKAELLDEAAQCLRLLSGRNHRVYTGDLPGDAEGGVPPAAGRDARALQAAVERATSRPISPPANGAARPAATRSQGLAGTLHRQDRRLLHQHRRPAAVRDRVAARRRGLSRCISAGSTRCSRIPRIDLRPMRRGWPIMNLASWL